MVITHNSSYTAVVDEDILKISEHSNFYEFEQEGGSPDNSDWRYFGTPSTPDYSALSTPVESTAITGGIDTKIGLFGNQRKNVEVLTEESKNQLFANVYINSYSTIGNNNIINTSAILEHEVTIGNHNHISVGAKLCGRAKIGNNCMIGAGAIVIDKISICDNVIIGAGAVVSKDITSSGTYVGVPARKIK